MVAHLSGGQVVAGSNPAVPTNYLQGMKAVEKIWLKHYVNTVPAEINPDRYQSIVEFLEESCQQYAEKPAFYSLGSSLTYQQIDRYSLLFAAYLQQSLQLKKGDRVGIMLPNILQYPVVMFGILRAGLTVVNINPLYTTPELVYQLQDSGAKALIVLANFAHTVQAALPSLPSSHIIVTSLGDLFPAPKSFLINFMVKQIKRKVPVWQIPGAILFKKTLSEAKNLTFQTVSVTHEDIAFLQYTGGTTGVSKGAILTHRNLVANVLQAETWFQPLLTKGQETTLTALPLYHIFSLMANCLFLWKMGACNILILNARDTSQMIREMKKFKLTVITGVNTLFHSLLKHPKFKSLDFSRLKLTLGGGMAVQSAVAEQWQATTGLPLFEAYGLTEASPCVCINPSNLKKYNGTVGLPVSSTDICILDSEDLHELPLGEAGELAIKGPQVMQAYWQNPTETKKVFTETGWLLTGDIASVDGNGYVSILERKKDMILVSGFNVYPNELEDVLTSMPGVREAAVVAVPDENSGEVPKAFIVRENQDITVEDVLEFCHTQLTGYKIPKHIKFCDELPKSAIGKVLRRALRDTHVKSV